MKKKWSNSFQGGIQNKKEKKERKKKGKVDVFNVLTIIWKYEYFSRESMLIKALVEFTYSDQFEALSDYSPNWVKRTCNVST